VYFESKGVIAGPEVDEPGLERPLPAAECARAFSFRSKLSDSVSEPSVNASSTITRSGMLSSESLSSIEITENFKNFFGFPMNPAIFEVSRETSGDEWDSNQFPIWA